MKLMRANYLNRLVALVITFLLVSCAGPRKMLQVQPQAKISSIRFLGEYDIPYETSFMGTKVGGLSGIDYDAGNKLYYLICDDRSAINPARYYKAGIYISGKGIDSLKLLDMNYLLRPGGEKYPNNRTDPYNTPDPEAIRYNPVKHNLTWSSEGERIVKEKSIVLSDPSITTISTGGSYVKGYTLPTLFRMQAEEKGPRQNGVFEGMSFADNYRSLYVNTEEPLYEDGPRADTVANDAYIRILKFRVKDKRNIKQFAYKLDPVAYPAKPADAYKINGVPDILSVDDNSLLVIERSYSTGRLACTVKVYLADLAHVTDISDNPSLKTNPGFTAAGKKLLLNMDDLGIYIDNIEGVCFGPVLENGHKTLLFVADNNFSPLEKSQVLLFEVIE